MIVRPLDENGDMMPIHSADQMIKDTEAIAQVIRLRLNMLYGEWWEDETLGFRIPEILAGNARRGDVDLLSKYVAAYVSESEGVRAVTNVTATITGHELSFYCQALTTDGDTATVEVDLNGLL